jgi:hypothetical protein
MNYSKLLKDICSGKTDSLTNYPLVISTSLPYEIWKLSETDQKRTSYTSVVGKRATLVGYTKNSCEAEVTICDTNVNFVLPIRFVRFIVSENMYFVVWVSPDFVTQARLELYNGDDLLHHDTLPAIYHFNGSLEYCYKGKRHRTDGPAYLGTQCPLEAHYFQGRLHNTNGPALVLASGTKVFYEDGQIEKALFQNGASEYHSDGKRIRYEAADETVYVFKGGKLHSDSGPAVFNLRTGFEEFYINGIRTKPFQIKTTSL